MSGVRQFFDVHVTGRATSDAKSERAGDRPLAKFGLMVSSGKNWKTKEFQKPFFLNVKCWGDRADHVRKGMDIEIFGYMTRNEYKSKDGSDKTWDEVVIKTDERGEPMINYEGRPVTTRGLSDEQVAAGKGRVIQVASKPQESLEITDEDIPF